MAVQPELKSSFLKNILEEEEYQSNVKALQDWLTGATQAATQQYQATAQTAAEQASYDISGAYANYLKQQRAVTAQGQLESGHKEEIGGALQQQYQGAYSQARTAQAQTVAKAQEQYGEDISYASQLYEKNKTALFEAAEKEADILASLFKAGEQYTGLTDYTQNITALGDQIRNESGEVIGTGKGIYEVDDQGYHTLTKYGTNVFRKALLQDEGFKNYLEEEGLTEELEYYLGNAASVHEDLFGFTETDYGISEESKKAIAEATYGTKGYAETITKPKEIEWNDNDFSGLIDFGQKRSEKVEESVKQLSDYGKRLGLSESETNTILQTYNKELSDLEEGKLHGKYKYDKQGYTQLYDDTAKMLLEASKKKYIKE